VSLSAAKVRFLLEAAFIVAVAAATAVARLDKIWIALSVAGAWGLVTFVERSAKQGRAESTGRRLSSLFARKRATEDPVPAPEPPAPLPDPPAPEPAPPAPDPEPRRPEPEQPTPQLRPVPPPEPELEPEPEPIEAPPQREQAPVLTFRPRADGMPREWNVWDLERIAQSRRGRESGRDEELAFLLLELRQFANADGQLPASFDPIVREAFGESLSAPV
jgi:hypothetical protein